jgi:hypothetical protein
MPQSREARALKTRGKEPEACRLFFIMSKTASTQRQTNDRANAIIKGALKFPAIIGKKTHRRSKKKRSTYRNK